MSMGLFQEDFYMVVSHTAFSPAPTTLGTRSEHRLLEWLQEDHSHPMPVVQWPGLNKEGNKS